MTLQVEKYRALFYKILNLTQTPPKKERKEKTPPGIKSLCEKSMTQITQDCEKSSELFIYLSHI